MVVSYNLQPAYNQQTKRFLKPKFLHTSASSAIMQKANNLSTIFNFQKVEKKLFSFKSQYIPATLYIS